MQQYKASELSILILRTKKDINGNPRALYVILAQGEIVQVIDIGCEGSGALRHIGGNYKALGFGCVCETIDIMPKEYRRLRKEYEDKKIGVV